MRENLSLLVALLLVLLVGVVGYRALFGPRGPALVVLDAEGQAVRVRPAAGAQPLVAGDALEVDDQLVVGDQGRLRVAIGAEAELTLQANSAMRLTEVTDDGLRVELEGGLLSARVRAGGPTLGVGARGRDLRLADGQINAALREDGALSVEVLAGELAVTGVPEVTELRAGARLDHGEGDPGLTTPIADRIPLRVLAVTPQAEAGLVVIAATTHPYARVELHGLGPVVSAQARPDGQVELPPVRVPNQGAPIELRATDALGRVGAATHQLEATAGPRLMGTAVQWGQ